MDSSKDNYNWITLDNTDSALLIIESIIYSDLAERLSPEDWEPIRKVVLHRDRYTCCNCHETNTRLDVHHVVPIANGGTNRLSNLKTLCFDCHKLIHPWMVKS